MQAEDSLGLSVQPASIERLARARRQHGLSDFSGRAVDQQRYGEKGQPQPCSRT